MLKPILCAASLVFSLSAIASDVSAVLPKIKEIAANPAIVAAVKEGNNKKLSLDAIKAIDEKWKSTSGNLPEAQATQSNEAATVLKTAETNNPSFKESILTDNQGANVAITALTSDYWQGDEPKFTKAFAAGKGEDYVARPKRDDSTGAVIAQISVPVMDAGAAIGTLTVGVDIGKSQ